MKKSGISVIAAAALMSVFMLAGCGDATVEKKETAPETTAATSAAESAAPEDKKDDSSAESKADESSAAEKKDEKKADESKAPEAKEPETKVPEQKPAADTASAADTSSQAPKAEPKQPEEAIKEFTPVNVPGDVYAGTFVEQTAGRATMQVTNVGGNTYAVHITWPVTLNEVNYWDLTGEFDGRGNLRYYNCRKTTAAYDDNGNYTVGTDGLQTPFTTYTAGSGILTRTDYGMTWTDDMGDILAGTTFTAGPGTTATTVEVPDDGGNNAQNTDTASNDSFSGNYYDGNGSKAWLDIFEADGEYYCTVSAQNNMGSINVWTFSGSDVNGTISYNGGQMSTVTYKEDGSLDYFEVVSDGHSGTIKRSNTGIVWEDSDGSGYVFINNQMAPQPE